MGDYCCGEEFVRKREKKEMNNNVRTVETRPASIMKCNLDVGTTLCTGSYLCVGAVVDVKYKRILPHRRDGLSITKKGGSHFRLSHHCHTSSSIFNQSLQHAGLITLCSTIPVHLADEWKREWSISGVVL